MKVSVKLQGFAEGEQLFRRASSKFSSAVAEALEAFGEKVVAEFKEDARSGMFGPPKARPDGKPPLIDTGTYIDSFVPVVNGNTLEIGPTGQNTRMSNAELSEVLEYGSAGVPPRPHLRRLDYRVEKNLKTLGKLVADALLGNAGSGSR